MNRRAKQAVYGLIYLLVIAIVAGGIYFFNFRPEASCFDGRKNQGEEGVDCGGPCGVCLSETFRPIRTDSLPSILPVPGVLDAFTLVANIQNPNSDLTARSFDYEFRIFSSLGEELTSIEGSSFIYASEIRPIVAPNVSIPGNPSRVEFSIIDAEWERSNELPKPSFDLRTQRVSVEDNIIRVEGQVVNRDTLSFGEIDAVSLFYDARRNLVGASRAEIRNVAPLESRDFSVLHPFLPGIDTALTRTTIHVYPIR